MLSFNKGKCKVMRLGREKVDFVYRMKDEEGEVVLQETELERDLGIHIDNKLRLKEHADSAVAKANKLLGLIRRSYDHIDATSLKCLYTSIVRPHIENGHSIWPLNYRSDLKLVENVQHRATKMIPSLKVLTYNERLKELDLPSIAYRRTSTYLENMKLILHSYNYQKIIFVVTQKS